MFAAIGRFSVRYRWPVVVAWLVVTGAAVLFLPSLGSVIKNDNTVFLPASSPSLLAARLAAPFLVADQESGTIVALRPAGPLSDQQQLALARLTGVARRVPLVTSVHEAAVSPDGQVATATVEFSPATAGGGPTGARAVEGLRALLRQSAVPGVVLYLTGLLPELVDQQTAASHTANRVALISGVFILLLLLLAFRSTLAPLVTLAPAGLALALAGPLIAESAKVGVEISSLMQLLLTALVLGAGTDYGLFLIFRYRENLRQGQGVDQAIVASVERVGESVTFSAITVIAALLSLLLATFGLYRGVGPGLAIGIGTVLVIELTFFPALLSIIGRRVFWPNVPRPGQSRPGGWGAVAARVATRPLVALVTGVVVLGVLALGLLSYAPSGFNPGGYITGSNSGVGQAVLEQHFGAAALDATDVVLRFGRSVWHDPSVIEQAQQGLKGSGEFTSLSDALDPNGVSLYPSLLAQAYHYLGPPGSLPAVEPRNLRLDPFFYNAYRATSQFVSDDGRTILFRVSLRAGSPGTTAALQAIPAVRRTVAQVSADTGAVQNGVAGQAAGAADVSSISGTDILRIAPLVLAVLGVLLALVLRSLVAPLYLVASVALSYVASLGLAVGIFVVIGGQLGINFTLPFFMFVFIMALGEDYNILVMSRIREEAGHLPLRDAVIRAIATTGTTVTSAGLVLAGTFAVLAITTSGQVRQIGTGLALGILLDTFVVRTLLVPSAAILTGRWNWWPSKLFYESPTGGD